MISNIFALLLGSGLASMIFFRERYSRFLSLLLLVLGGALLFNFYENWQFGTSHRNIFHIFEYEKLSLEINLSSTPAIYALVFPFFGMGVLSLYNTLTSVQEEQRGRLSGLIMLDLAFLILLSCSANLLIILGCSALIGVVGLFVINNFESKKTYIFYNLTSDMALFTAFSIVYTARQSVDLSALNQYAVSGSEPLLVGILILLSIAIKSGLFMFHNQIFCYRHLSFNRMIFLNYCVAPAASLILLSKMSSVFANLDTCRLLIYGLAGLSILYGFLGALVYDNIKEKALSLNVLLWGFIYGYVISSPNISVVSLSWLVLLFYLLNWWLQLVIRSFSDEIYISKMGGTWQRLILLQLMGAVLVFGILQRLCVMADTTQDGQVWLWVLSGSILIIVPYLFVQIFYGENHCDERVWAFLQNPKFHSWFPFFVICGLILFHCGYYSWSLGVAVLFMLGLSWLNPLRFVADIYEKDEVQLAEFFERMYEYIIVAPINILGRILWLTVDFLLIERTIINSFSNLTEFLIRVSKTIHTPRALAYILMTAFGLLMLFFLVQVQS